MTEKKVLIISRKYPPSIGGMQAYARDFINRMEKRYDVSRIVMGLGQINLIWFIPYMLIKSSILLARGKYDLIWLCDGLLAPAGVFFKGVFKVKVAVTVHGLDMTYNRFFYQSLVPKAIAALDKVICVSASTMDECVKRGVPANKCKVITNGIEAKPSAPEISWDRLCEETEKAFGDDVRGKKVLITVGRLIKRKGVAWFTRNVMPKLSDEHVYLVAGDGPERENIEGTIESEGMAGRVKLLGKISDEHLRLLYRAAHAMVIPNQKIGDDTEGFGIVAIEAASFGIPVIANSLEGLKQAVLEGRTGWLVDYNDVGQFTERINDIGLHTADIIAGSKIFSWDKVIEEYKKVIDEI